jgi:radical SAM superfamily enzyme YgiQ (UPF0313 family)
MGGSIFFGTFGAGSENFQSLVSKNEFSFVDHFVIGPGELPFSYLLDGNLSDERVIYSCSVSNSPIAIEDIPMPDFSDFDMNIYPSIGIEGSRGCPFSCEFCIESNQWGPYANKSGGDLADEILTYSNRYQKSKFFLCDSVTNAYIDDLSSNLIKKRSDIYFDAFLRSDKSVLTKNVSNWAKAGLGCVRTGIESGSSRVLKLMNKKITSKISEDCLRLIADNGIRPLTFWVIGFPGETTDDFQETLEYIRRNKTWIYEIEAHPFVTFETDQPSSTTHRIKKCYPEEVTNITKLQLWETVAEPSPGERYKRLVEVELTAKECGIPTINTLADFAKAEKRWKDLHSNAINIFR